MNIGDKLYAVTDEHYIIPLVVTRVEFFDNSGFVKTTTKIDNPNPDRYSEGEHRDNFKTLWVRDNNLETHNVFKNSQEARSHAMHKAELTANKLEAELRTVRRRIGELFIQKFAEGLPK